MSLLKVFGVAGSAMSAETARLNTIASNLANADTVAGSPEEAYKARKPLFQSALADAADSQSALGVTVAGIMQSAAPAQALHQPGHPLADANGYVWGSNVNTVEEMVDMISASRSYENNVEVLNTSKELLLRTLRLGQ
jgi:flagellar basal-body rod protein FlgC